MDGWPHSGDGARIVRQISSQERGSSVVEAYGAPDADVRRLTGEMAGGGRSDGRLTLRRANLRVAGGVLLLLSPFMDGHLCPGGKAQLVLMLSGCARRSLGAGEAKGKEGLACSRNLSAEPSRFDPFPAKVGHQPEPGVEWGRGGLVA